MNRIVGIVAIMLARKMAGAALSKVNRARAKLELGEQTGFEAHGRVMMRKKMAGRYLTLQHISELASELKEADDDLYFYYPDPSSLDRQYVHAVRLTRVSNSENIEVEVLPSWCHKGVWIKNVEQANLTDELSDLIRRLPDLKKIPEDFTFRGW